MKKFLLIVSLAISSFQCTEQKGNVNDSLITEIKKKEILNVSDNKSKRDKIKATTELQTGNLIEYIKQNCSQRIRSFNSDTLNFIKQIDTVFLKKYIFGKRLNESFAFPSYTFPSYYWGDYFENDSVFYFSFQFNNEYCCHTLYGVTLASEGFEILDISEITLSGGDGGWYRFDQGEWISDTTIELIQYEQYDELTYEQDSTTIHYDTTWIQLSYSNSGLFSKTVKDSSSVTRKVFVGQK